VTAGSAAPSTGLIEEAALLLSLAARPVIWAGGGAVAAGAWDELADVAGLLGAPVVTSTSGKGAMAETHPLAVGSLFGAPEVARLLGQADAAVAVGTSFSARSTKRGQLPLPLQLFHIDVDAAVFSRRYPARSGIVGDARAVLASLAGGLGARPAGPARNGAAERVAPIREAARERLGASGPPPGSIDALRRAIPAEIPTVWDGGPARWGVPLFPVPVPGTFHAPAPDAPPGHSPVVALGLTRQRRGPAVALVGAGDVADLAPLAEAGLPVVVLALENEAPVALPPAAGGAASGVVRVVRVDDEAGLALSVAEGLTSAAPTLIRLGIPFS
jgi:acetolactate synthase-1/2/3 large subunit